MRKKVSLSTLSREKRGRDRESKKKASTRRANRTRRNLRTVPSESLGDGWSRKSPPSWNANDALAFYAVAYKRELGDEDAELTTAVARKKGASVLRSLLDSLQDGECPKEYIEYAIGHCLRGRGFPSDRVPSVTAICYRSIVLKRWRIERRNSSTTDARRRGRDWESGV